VEKVWDHGTIGTRKYPPPPKKEDNCKNLGKRRNLEKKF
jgi:hypothetical protein